MVFAVTEHAGREGYGSWDGETRRGEARPTTTEAGHRSRSTRRLCFLLMPMPIPPCGPVCVAACPPYEDKRSVYAGPVLGLVLRTPQEYAEALRPPERMEVAAANQSGSYAPCDATACRVCSVCALQTRDADLLAGQVCAGLRKLELADGGDWKLSPQHATNGASHRWS